MSWTLGFIWYHWDIFNNCKKNWNNWWNITDDFTLLLKNCTPYKRLIGMKWILKFFSLQYCTFSSTTMPSRSLFKYLSRWPWGCNWEKGWKHLQLSWPSCPCSRMWFKNGWCRIREYLCKGKTSSVYKYSFYQLY